MATISKVWNNEATIVATNAYGGTDADLAADSEWDFSGDIDLEADGFEGALVYLAFTASGLTDNIVLGIFPSVDGATPNRATDGNPIIQIEYTNGGGDTQQPPVVVKDLQHFEVGVKTNGTTDTFDYKILWDAWRWDST